MTSQNQNTPAKCSRTTCAIICIVLIALITAIVIFGINISNGLNYEYSHRSNSNDSILLANLSSFKSQIDSWANHRRLPAIPQLIRNGGNASKDDDEHGPSRAECDNIGADDLNVVNWKCDEMLMDDGFAVGKVCGT